MTEVETSRSMAQIGEPQALRLDVAAGFDRLCQIPKADGLEAFLQKVAGPLSPWDGPEFSITWGPGPPRARVFVQTKLEPSSTHPALHAAEDLFRRLCNPHATIAGEVLRAVYHGATSSSGSRLGVGVECNTSGTVGMRLYLDLFARGKERAAWLRRELLQRWNAAEAFEVAARELADGDEIPLGRILGVDFPMTGQPRLKAYLPARRFPPGAILETTGAAASALREVLNTLGGDPSPLDRPSTLWSFGFPGRDSQRPADGKLDFQLADFAADDAEAQRKVEGILAALRLDLTPYRDALGIAMEGALTHQSQGVHQYLGVQRSAAAGWRAAVYFRPVSSGGAGVSRRAQPRRRASSRPQTAIEKGLQALHEMLGDGPLWRDFECSIGPSDEWTTAYVVARLREVPETAAMTSRAATQLARRQRPDGGWGYNAAVGSDCDSTAWALLALRANEIPAAARERAVEFLLMHQDESGGFSTYRQALRPKREDLRPDWFRPQPCVTAAAVSALLRCGASPTDSPMQRAIRYLRSANPQSCWWPDQAYVLAAVAAVFVELGWQPPPLATPRAPSSAFSLANALSLTVMLGRPESEDLAGRLVGLQHDDGRWPSAPILRIPDDTPGITTISADQNGSFATATAVWALSLLRNRQEMR